MKRIILVLMLIFMAAFLYAQSTELDNVTDVKQVPVDTGRLLLREISIDTFEDPTNWVVSIPVDKGNTKVLRILGAPGAKEVLRLEEQVNNYNPTDRYVLGVRASFYGRTLTTISVKARKEIFIPGVAKTLSVWVAGREKAHDISVVLRDMDGVVKTIPMGLLNFTGWRKLEITIPNSINQKDLNTSLHGLYFIGFKINTHFEDTVGTYYVYFDDMRVVSDVIDDLIKNAQFDDISDGW